MRNAFLAFGLVLTGGSSFAQTWIKSPDALSFKGQMVNVIGQVIELSSTADLKRRGAWLTLETRPSVQPLRIFISAADRKELEALNNHFLNQYIHARGRIITKRGKPHIRLSSRNQITVLHEAPEVNRFEPL